MGRSCTPALVVAGLLVAAVAGCGEGGASADADADGAVQDGDDGDGREYRDSPDAPEGPYHDPWVVMPSGELPPVRGWVIRRGIVHAHSPYSHDACDDEPFTGGVRNEQCFEDLRWGMCATAQDFVFLTDHGSLFVDYEYPDVLLYKDGDTLIERGGEPVANRVACGAGREVVVAAGTESGTMPIGLEHHVGGTPGERSTAYDDVSEAGVRALQAAGALVFLAHTEGWAPEDVIGLPIDGIEIYNLHQNLMDNMGVAINMVVDMSRRPERVPTMELGVVPLFEESAADLERWSRAVAVKRLPGVLATDVHRNTFDAPSPDGERIDSFRRLMHWFSNYALVPPGVLDDAVLKDAIARGRTYGVFDHLGYAVGFDFHALVGGTVYEMGEEVPAGAAVELRLSLPGVWRLDPTGPAPSIRGRILRAGADGAWDEVASGTTDLSYPAAPGVYRAEVRMIPEHLRPWLGALADDYLALERIWVYSNPIYVGMGY